MKGFSLDRIEAGSDKEIVTRSSDNLSPLSSQRYLSQISSPKMDVNQLYPVALVAVGEGKDTNVVTTGGANQLNSVTSSIRFIMANGINIGKLDEAGVNAIWPYLVTGEEIWEQQYKCAKMSQARYAKLLDLMQQEQPALHGYLIAYAGSAKSRRGGTGLAIWLAYKAKFENLPEVKDRDIGMELRLGEEIPELRNWFCGADSDATITERKEAGDAFRMMLNGLEQAVTPRKVKVFFIDNFRKRCWVDARQNLALIDKIAQ